MKLLKKEYYYKRRGTDYKRIELGPNTALWYEHISADHVWSIVQGDDIIADLESEHEQILHGK